ncbi:hypothetical protein BC826DRAFT_1107407 [Russula brevipes]|nr:hypothetical protein BC826DRAFT_1107407 [Russula brevipes]
MGSHSDPRKRVCHQVSAVTSKVSPALLPKIPEPWIPISGLSRELVIRGHSVHHRGETSEWGRRGQVSIDILPDEVLLEIFEIDTVPVNPFIATNRWHKLVHVCRRWRSVVFASTHRLNLELQCTYTTPVRKMLDIWPALPIVIEGRGRGSRAKGADNIVAALGHPDRVRSIKLWNTPISNLKQFAAEMKDPFPALTHLWLNPATKVVPVLPDSFLGGSAPHLQTLQLDGVPFPAMPKLLSSASDFVILHLHDIPHSGYISPEAMVTCLCELTRLKTLSIEFRSPLSRPDEPSPPRSIRIVLPALNQFVFRGVSEYLEDLTSQIDAPLLSSFHITFFNQLIFNTPRLCTFLSHAEKLGSQSHAEMSFDRNYIELSLKKPGRIGLQLTILCRAPDWQLSSLAQVCNSPPLSLCNLERLEICGASRSPCWQEDVEHTQWLELLHPFTTVKSLSLSKEFTPRIVPALQELSGERIMDVLPGLQSIFLSKSSLSKPVKKALAQFLTARQLSGRPVVSNPLGQE